VARRFSNPSWKVIVSASRGQYLKPGSFGPGFFFRPQAFIDKPSIDKSFIDKPYRCAD
jgi:hypothetical protein